MSVGVTLPDTMRAAFVRALGGPEQIVVDELPVPTPGPDDVLVRVDACSANPVDTFVRSGAYATPTPFPFVIGRDLVGTDVATGERVWSHSMGHGGRQGAAARYVAVPRERLYPVPDGVDPMRLLASVHPAATAWLALRTHGRLTTGERVLVRGGGGNVGGMALAIAREVTADVLTTASAADLDRCRSHGASVALDYRDPDLPARLREAAPGGIDVQVDTSGHQDLAEAVGLLSPRGRIVLLAGMGERPELPVGPLYTRDGSVVGFAISNARVEELAETAAAINDLLVRDVLPEPRIEVRDLGEARTVHEDLEAGRLHGTRVLLTL